MQRYLRWNGGQICMAQLDVESPFRFSSFILFIDSLLDHTAAIQKSDGAKKTPNQFLNFLTSTGVLKFFAVHFQTGPQLLCLFSNLR